MKVYILMHITTPEDYEIIGVYDAVWKTDVAKERHDKVCTDAKGYFPQYEGYEILEFTFNEGSE